MRLDNSIRQKNKVNKIIQSFYVFIFIMIISTCFVTISCKKAGQSEINAGISNCSFLIADSIAGSCYEIIDFDPDSVLPPNKNTKSVLPFLEYRCNLDLNNDLSNDMDFLSYVNMSPGGWGDYGCSIEKSNNNFELASDDTSYLKLFNKGDTIWRKNKWINKNYMKISVRSFYPCPPFCPGSNIEKNQYVNNKYIGLREISATDTSYYWIKINVSNYTSVTIYGFCKRRK